MRRRYLAGALAAAEPRAKQLDVGGVLGDPARGLADHRGAGRLDDPDQGVEVDLALAEVLVAVPARVGPVLGVLAWEQGHPTGDGLDPVDDAVQVLAAGVGVAGVEAESQ